MKHRELTAEAGRLFDEGLGHKAVASRLCVPEGTARNWEYAYRALGKEALLNGRKLSYSQDLKLEAVRLIIEEGMSKPQVMERLGIKSKTALERWMREFRAGGADALAPKPRGRRPRLNLPHFR